MWTEGFASISEIESDRITLSNDEIQIIIIRHGIGQNKRIDDRFAIKIYTPFNLWDLAEEMQDNDLYANSLNITRLTKNELVTNDGMDRVSISGKHMPSYLSIDDAIAIRVWC